MSRHVQVMCSKLNTHPFGVPVSVSQWKLPKQTLSRELTWVLTVELTTHLQHDPLRVDEEPDAGAETPTDALAHLERRASEALEVLEQQLH